MACLNPGDVQSRHIMSEDGQAECLYSGVGNRGGQQYVMVHRKRAASTVETSQTMSDTKLYARSNSGSCEEKKWL